jgi:hypothetical protein
MTERQLDHVMATASSLVRCLRTDGDWSPLFAKLDAREIRDVLAVLAEFDTSLLLQLTEELVLELCSAPG